ncbi:glycosyltransferase family protein [Paraburkholderia phenoliruptrix]|uniref:Group 1 glucosyll transferase n=2 Tax=Paraburkholderia phenoliruptrix TaxID=252970 RepID=K0DJ69_9BURK|nr:hypothetical protein [Paraburkholderia phenoliruptrix]AFT84805.1 hypothetical protein BUPH_05540 [Paraburkholderia phenoliruptrix BR3459a]CAB4050502.1 hypothetical protein LMG9964_04168 [Paraburkholderia phenoliruptrix]
MSWNSREADPISVDDAVAEGWAYRKPTSRNKARILAAISPRDRAREWCTFSTEEAMSRELFRRALMAAADGATAGVLIALSHDHYLTIGGGVQNCIGDEQATLCARGWAYLHICPNRPLPLLADAAEPESFYVFASLNGKPLGVVLMSDIQAIAAELARAGRSPRCVVHHMLGFAPELIAGLVQACDDGQPLVWLHDLFTLCPSVHLLRNDATFCFAPPVDSAVCHICNAGPDRLSHVQRMQNFFASTHPIVIAPSETLLEFWKLRGNYAHRDLRVIAPCELVFDDMSRPFESGRPLRVAFFGSPIYHKGWDAFESLVRWHSRDARYAFYHFGSVAPKVPGLLHVPVTVTRENRSAMIEAARVAQIDVVINWSMCYESFSFTAMEALASGAFVVARRDAGNVWPLIRAVSPRRGCSVAGETELQALFAEGQILSYVSEADRRAGSLVFGSYTGELLESEVPNA